MASKGSKAVAKVVSVVLTLVVCPALVAGCKEGRVARVRDVVVRVATASGEWIEVRARSTYQGVAALWKDIWGRERSRDGAIEVDPRDPLTGRYVRDLEIRIVQPDGEGRKDETRVLLRRPSVHRPTADSEDWTLAKSNFPAAAGD